MKMKSMAMLVATGIVAAAVAHIAPAMADDMSSGDQSNQLSAPSDNGSSNSMDQGNDNMGSSNSMDQGSPDTATGDDDY